VVRVVGVREYARHRNCSHAAVIKAIKQGRLAKAVTKGTRGPRIDVDAADLEWEANPAATQQRQTGPRPGAAGEQGTLFRDRNGRSEPPAEGLTLARARAVRETYLSQLAKLEYEERKGELQPTRDVEARAFAAGRRVRDAVLSVAPAIANELLAVKDAREMERRLEEALMEALTSASREQSDG
jgi:hypothetical protein